MAAEILFCITRAALVSMPKKITLKEVYNFVQNKKQNTVRRDQILGRVDLVFTLADDVNLTLQLVLLSVWRDACEQGRGLLTQRVVEESFDLSAAVDAFLEVDFQQILQGLTLHDGRDSCQQHRPRTQRHLGLERGKRHKQQSSMASFKTVKGQHRKPTFPLALISAYLQVCNLSVQKRCHSHSLLLLLLQLHIMVLCICQTFGN